MRRYLFAVLLVLIILGIVSIFNMQVLSCGIDLIVNVDELEQLQIRGLAELGEQALPVLKTVLRQSTDWRQRWRAVLELAEIGPEATSTLMLSLTDSAWQVRTSGVAALGQLAPHEAWIIAELKLLAVDPQEEVRMEAINSLARYGALATDALPWIAVNLGDPKFSVRRSAGRAIAQIAADFQPIPALLQLLLEEDIATAIAALETMVFIEPGSNIVPDLVQALDRDDVLVRRSVAQHLIQLGDVVDEMDPESRQMLKSSASVVFVALITDGLNEDVVQGIKQILTASGQKIVAKTAAELETLSPRELRLFDVIIVNPSISRDALAAQLVEHVQTQGHLIVLPSGVTDPGEAEEFGHALGLWLYSTSYHEYTLLDIAAIRPYNQGDTLSGLVLLEQGEELRAPMAGQSALGYGFPNESEFLPVLQADDAYGRALGWAAGLVVNYGGAYRGSHWLLYGIHSPEFYSSQLFLHSLQSLVGQMAGATLADKVQERNYQRSLPTMESLPDRMPIQVDGQQLVYSDGSPFFMVGVNWMGTYDRLLSNFWSGDYFDYRVLENAFQRLQAAGINTIRIFTHNTMLSSPEKVRALLELARKHGIYLIVPITTHAEYATDEALAERVRKVVGAFGDDPMVLVYDLQNEPYLGDISSIRFNQQPSPILQLQAYENYRGQYDAVWVGRQVANHRPGQFPRIGRWIHSQEDLQNLYAAINIWGSQITGQYTDQSLRRSSESFSLFDAPRLAPPMHLQEFYQALQETFELWIQTQAQIIRKMAPNAMITVGYNTMLTFLPANAELDFLNHHVYTIPDHSRAVLDSVTVMDRIRGAWPGKPVSLGEFGHTNGYIVDGRPLDMYNSSVSEIVHYLYAYAQGYSGVSKWRLTDTPTPFSLRFNTWLGDDPANHYSEGRYGMYYYDGTLTGRAKPIVYCTQFFRMYLDAYGPGGGALRLIPAQNQNRTEYVYQGEHALFVGAANYQSPGLIFSSVNGSPANVMLMFDDSQLQLMATTDVEFTVTPSWLNPQLGEGDWDIRGEYAWLMQDGDGKITGKLLAGSVITVRRTSCRFPKSH